MAQLAAVSANQPHSKHHYVRTIISSFFGFLALALIIISILVLWLGHTLTNTDQYVKTVAPLVDKPAVQDFAVDKASAALLENKDAPLRDVATKLLGAEQIAGKTDDQLRMEITPKIEASLRQVVTSEQFARLWEDNNRAVHAQLVSQLDSDKPAIDLNFNPLIKGVVDQLGATDLSFVKDELKIKDDAGMVALEGEELENARNVYSYFKKAIVLAVLSAVLAAILCIVISVNHLKTLRRIAVATGIFAAVLAVALSATSLVKPSGKDGELAFALVGALTGDLRLALSIIAVVCLGGAIGSKVYSVVKNKKK